MSKVKVTTGKELYNLLNTIDQTLKCIHVLIFFGTNIACDGCMNCIDFKVIGQRSRSLTNVGCKGDATLCVVWLVSSLVIISSY